MSNAASRALSLRDLLAVPFPGTSLTSSSSPDPDGSYWVYLHEPGLRSLAVNVDGVLQLRIYDVGLASWAGGDLFPSEETTLPAGLVEALTTLRNAPSP